MSEKYITLTYSATSLPGGFGAPLSKTRLVVPFKETDVDDDIYELVDGGVTYNVTLTNAGASSSWAVQVTDGTDTLRNLALNDPEQDGYTGNATWSYLGSSSGTTSTTATISLPSDVERRVRDRLISESVGVSSRIYPEQAPQATSKPYITYSNVSRELVVAMGPSQSTTVRSRLQIDIWGDTRSSVKTVEKNVREALGGWSSDLYAITSVLEESSTDRMETQDNASDEVEYGASMDFIVWHY